jgi:hypothetical protein
LTYFFSSSSRFLPPDRYADADLAFIVPRVLELTYTAHDLKPWAEDLGYDGDPSRGTPSAAPNSAPNSTPTTPASTA